MTEELQILWSLHGLDEQLATLNAALHRHPVQRKSLSDRVGAERTRLEGYKQQVAAKQVKRREIERDVEALQVEERKFQSQLPMVKKNEEYQALLHEITASKARRSERETELLLLLDEEERLQGERPELERTLAGVESEAASRGREIDAEEQREREQAGVIEARRDAFLARLPAATRARYERIRGSRDGRAVVPIVKGACGGCYRGQPPQVLQEARRSDRLLTCEGCGRLLVWPPDAV
ncbi:MAG TPA: C4-type zinc ribbon domain-containing protein [Candidatus Limnocylindria bacterium]|nr:C4-type zinc ribbon domain-containing protein [Candidatus Limnocylindria bacterium]